jgi:hypothetical protein
LTNSNLNILINLFENNSCRYSAKIGVEDILFLLIFSLEHDVLKINYNIYMNYYLSKINEHIEYLPDKYKSDIKKSLEDFIGHCIVGLYIKDCFSKIKNQKINGYLKNFLYILSIYS